MLKTVAIIKDPHFMRIMGCKYGCVRGHCDRNQAEGSREPHAMTRDVVDIGCRWSLWIVTAQIIRTLSVHCDENNVVTSVGKINVQEDRNN